MFRRHRHDNDDDQKEREANGDQKDDDEEKDDFGCQQLLQFLLNQCVKEVRSAVDQIKVFCCLFFPFCFFLLIV